MLNIKIFAVSLYLQTLCLFQLQQASVRASSTDPALDKRSLRAITEWGQLDHYAPGTSSRFR